ncbi:MAG TPA: hypothetical protein VL652_30515, partial [Kutzneria sp.]|nr:hypothetical protein [Kutzneria sp.]
SAAPVTSDCCCASWPPRLRWSVGGETAIAVVVLGLTAALVSTSPADTTLRPTTVAAQTGTWPR